ncbi:hypothetical protein PV396_04105 [Streptomyces sp. ME02-8801-2C]|uniref:hypothetical protein n=1 Tax=Streptomyces sp. ME02-8801-2C TaxID=3028680 RepID=UPI0029B8AE83|nr:hypothetical protein [Streptomyces sp. ME02-8801-2C]MDX3451138.1 hypothetical protein [Streptomyces sp. ME02-8801-2C]
MPQSVRLVAALTAPRSFSRADDAPYLAYSATARLLVQRTDSELIVQEIGSRAATWATAPEVSFPAPWPRRFGQATVSPAGDLAVFTGAHALRAVDRSGSVRWELRHRCWAGCAGHSAFEEYAEDGDHRYAGSGSAAFSADGKLVWAHTCGPLVQDRPDSGETAEEWLVIDATDGSVLARAETGTVAAGSVHVPSPDPGRMGLSIGEGQDGSPLRWGRWDGANLLVDRFGNEDRALMSVSPSGDRLLTVTHYQDALAILRVDDGSVEAELDTDEVPRHPESEPSEPDDEAEAFFDYEGGFIDEANAVVGTVESDEEFGAARHWLVDTAPLRIAGELVYPHPVSSLPTALGDGTWYTPSAADNALHVWALRPADGSH